MTSSTASRARSRLSRSRKNNRSVERSVSPVVPATPTALSHRKASKQLLNSLSSALETKEISSWVQKHVPNLLLCAISAVVLILLLTTVPPSKVADVGLAQTYLPFLVVSALCLYSILSLILRRRHAVMLTFLLIILIFFRLHSVRIAWTYILLPFTLGAAIELVVLLAKKR